MLEKIDAQFHHIGIASKSIEKDILFYSMLDYQPEAPPFEDSIQGIRGQFLVGGGPRLELLENLPGSETLTPWLKSGVKMYHFGYYIRHRLDEEIAEIENQGALLVRPPQPAIAFAGQRICFFMMRNGMMIELIELEDGLV